jgi:hypothetical protein
LQAFDGSLTVEPVGFNHQLAAAFGREGKQTQDALCIRITIAARDADITPESLGLGA